MAPDMAKKEHMRTKTDHELATELAATREKLRTERFAAAGARPKDSSAPMKLRKEIARILTERRARSLSSQPR